MSRVESRQTVYQLTEEGRALVRVGETLWRRAGDKRALLDAAVIGTYFGGDNVDFLLVARSIIEQAATSDFGEYRGQLSALESEAGYTARVLGGNTHLNRNNLLRV